MSNSNEEIKDVFAPLVDWIHLKGGHVHPSLVLRREEERGIFCFSRIAKGEVLIRLPASLVLCGAHLPAVYGNQRTASPWLRCLAALYKECYNSSILELTSLYQPYLSSLPKEYETLFQWTSDEISLYLGGTSLASQLQVSDTDMETRYTASVRPYLAYLSLVPPKMDQNEVERFRQVCMCLSTRGFHMSSTAGTADPGGYAGPFLLPLVDLINHDPSKACTTLQHTADGNFCMTAERDLQAGEQVFHSYGNAMTSAQILQTFGFVPQDSIQRLVDGTPGVTMATTPAILTREEIVDACTSMVQSGYPNTVQAHMKESGKEDEVWPVPSWLGRDLSSTSSHFLIDRQNPLPEELVTLVCLLLLPSHAYRELSGSSLVGPSVLQDYYLGKLACQTILTAIQTKLATYPKGDKEDIEWLRDLQSAPAKTLSDKRAMYGLTVRLEEKASLDALRKTVLEIMDSLDDNDKTGGVKRNGTNGQTQAKEDNAENQHLKKQKVLESPVESV